VNTVMNHEFNYTKTSCTNQSIGHEINILSILLINTRSPKISSVGQVALLLKRVQCTPTLTPISIPYLIEGSLRMTSCTITRNLQAF
jgi:hypothetical protein